MANFNTRSQDGNANPNADLIELGVTYIDRPGHTPAEGGRSGGFDKRVQNQSTSTVFTPGDDIKPPVPKTLDLPTERTGGVRPNGVSERDRGYDRKRTGGVGPTGVGEKDRS